MTAPLMTRALRHAAAAASAAVLVALGTPAAAGAQGDAVPLELARVLAAPPGTRDPFGAGPATPFEPTITIGAAPPAFPRALVPAPPLTLLGGIQTGPGDARIVAVVPAGRDSAAALFARALAAAGWNAPESAASTRGFVAATPAMGTVSTLCRGDTAVVARDAPRTGGGRYLLVSASVGARFSVCNQRAFGADRPFGDAPIPTLVAPAGTRTVGGGGSGGGGDDWRSSTRLLTGLAPAALVAHYAAQLARQGWTARDRAAGGSVVVQSADRTLPNGDVWRATLVVDRLPGVAESDVTLRLLRLPSR